MSFKVSARTILHLGAELISSDAVAFYELIKNSFDAGSPKVKIEVLSRIEYEVGETLRTLIKEERDKALKGKDKAQMLDSLREQFLEAVKQEAPEAEALCERIEGAGNLEEFESILDDANRIVVSDTGEGMSLEDLEEIYLTIGTPTRLKQRTQGNKKRNAGKERPILGEKGIGRLSAMRLGWRLHVETTKAGDEHWNVLDIDWRKFEDLERMIGDIPVKPIKGEEKGDESTQGTRLYISALAAPWSEDKLVEIARLELAKFTDPFSTKHRFPIDLQYNGEIVAIPRLQDLLFQHAHMKVNGKYVVDDEGCRFKGEMWVRENLVDRTDKLIRTFEQLLSMTKANEATLRRLGPFDVLLYWFNRKIMTDIDGIGSKQEVRNLQKRWSGVMLFRDGFRIHPYGGVDDDWLEFDRLALSRSSYKLNKDQFIGKIDITREHNPGLIDQANREGLKDTLEKATLIKIIHNLVQVEVWRIMVAWEKEAKSAQPGKVIESKFKRVQNQVGELGKLLLDLQRSRPQEAPKAKQMEELLQEIVHDVLPQTQKFVEHTENERSITMHLAGTGLLIEILAHELTRATNAALATVARIQKSRKPEETAKLLDTLQAQLKTLQKRLRMLDPFSTAGRQVKETFDIIDWTAAILETHAEQFELDHIHCPKPVVEPKRPKDGWSVRMVKGMYVQILENLLSNSIYWLRFQRKRSKSFTPEIHIVLNPSKGTIRVTDNGPGIPYEHAEEIFKPFFTTKPPGESRGLGLYIAQEIAKYHNITLTLSAEPTFHEERYNSIVITLPQEEASE